MTPNELAAELGISPKTLRQWLRDFYGRAHVPYDRWHLTPAMVEHARARWLNAA